MFMLMFFSKVHPACHNIAKGIKPGSNSKTSFGATALKFSLQPPPSFICQKDCKNASNFGQIYKSGFLGKMCGFIPWQDISV